MSGEGIIFSSEAAYHKGTGTMFMLDAPKPAAAPAKVQPEPNPVLLNNIFAYAQWGDDNLFPQRIIELAAQSAELAPLLDWKSRAAQGKEVLPYIKKYDLKTNSLKEEFVNDEEILAFLSTRQFKHYIREAYIDFFWFGNVFPDLIKSGDGTKIAQLNAHDASHCRWTLQNDKGVVPYCWITPNWGILNGMVDAKTALIVDVIDPYDYFAVDKLKASSRIERVVYPISYPSPGKTYYQLATWDGFRTTGWLNYASQIPVFKQALLTNAMHIKYLIKVPTTYWPAKYKDWHTLSQADQDGKKKATLDEINAKLTNAINAGKSILNEVGFDDDGKPIPGWDIIVIDDKNRDGFLNSDSQEASAYLMRALQLDDSLLSKFPGKGMGAGSGSDTRVAFNLYCAMQEPYRDIILEPLHFIAEYNGWKVKYPTLFFKTVEIELQTLDQGSTSAPKGTPKPDAGQEAEAA